MAENLAETGAPGGPGPANERPGVAPGARRQNRGEIPEESIPADALPLANHYADLPLGIEVELDRKKMTVRDILRLKPGSVLRMGRSAGENIDIRVGGALMGFGEIVILEERMGVRITDFHEGD